MELHTDILNYIDEHKQEAFELLLTLAQIPAPSNHEEKRAAFCKQWLEDQGAEGVYIDEALNVVYPIGCTENNSIVVYMAHIDVVFPDTDPLPLKIQDGKVCCPGIGDDTANVVALLTVAKYIAKHKLQPKGHGVLLVLDSGEEGLGNLKGCKKIMERYGHRVKEFIAVDGGNSWLVTGAVGSKRYQVDIHTEGGHSYSAFGNRNAIAYMASLINTLYDIKVPAAGKTTYNVGTITGGTSVNTIAQHAQMLYEIRSSNRESLAEMDSHFHAAIEYYRTKNIDVQVTLMGDRPCSGNVDPQLHQELIDRVKEAVAAHYEPIKGVCSGSTDCNIPLSMDIPAISVGAYIGAGSHTREEYLHIDSLYPGLKLIFQLILHHF